MAAIPYPLDLRTVLATKSRSQPARFFTTDPRRGPLFVQPIGTNPGVVWQAQFRFNRDEAIRFRLWFETDMAFGTNEFVLPIDTEFGVIDHTCQFLPDSLLDTSQGGNVFTYSANIYARVLTTPQGYIDASDIIIALPNWQIYANLLDIAINQAWPS